MSRRKNKKKIYKTKWLMITFGATVIILGAILVSKSRYAIRKNNTVQINTNNFYFESSQLEEGTTTYDDWNGNDNYSIDFNVSNYKDSLRTSTADVEYKITAEIVEPKNNNLTAEIYINNEKKQTGTLKKDQNQDDEIRIAIKNDGGKINQTLEVKVVAQSTAPYEKTITETYKINPSSTESSKNEEYEVNLQDKEDYENLLIKTNLYSGNITVNYDSSKLTVYQGYDILENAEYSKEKIKIQVSNKKNYQIQFIKNNSQDKITLNKDITIQTGE